MLPYWYRQGQVVLISESESVLTGTIEKEPTGHRYDTDSTVRTSELEYTIAAIINRQGMSCTMHMILDECDIAYMVLMTVLIWYMVLCVEYTYMVMIWDELHDMSWSIWYMIWIIW